MPPALGLSQRPRQVQALPPQVRNTSTFVSERNSSAWTKQELQHALAGPCRGPRARCVPQNSLALEHERGQRIWVQDPPALFSFCGFRLRSDPSAKEMLHCLRDWNRVAQPVSEQALSKLPSNLCREKELKTKRRGEQAQARKLLCLSPPKIKEGLFIDQFEQEKNGRVGEQQYFVM